MDGNNSREEVKKIVLSALIEHHHSMTVRFRKVWEEQYGEYEVMIK